MNDEQPNEIIITHGINAHTKAGAISGVDSDYDADGRPLVILALRPGESPSSRVNLYEGDTFQLEPELWQVTEITRPNTDRWAAKLTQLR